MRRDKEENLNRCSMKRWLEKSSKIRLMRWGGREILKNIKYKKQYTYQRKKKLNKQSCSKCRMNKEKTT